MWMFEIGQNIRKVSPHVKQLNSFQICSRFSAWLKFSNHVQFEQGCVNTESKNTPTEVQPRQGNKNPTGGMVHFKLLQNRIMELGAGAFIALSLSFSVVI